MGRAFAASAFPVRQILVCYACFAGTVALASRARTESFVTHLTHEPIRTAAQNNQNTIANLTHVQNLKFRDFLIFL